MSNPPICAAARGHMATTGTPPKVLILCLSPTLQKTLVVNDLVEDEVNRCRSTRLDASGLQGPFLSCPLPVWMPNCLCGTGLRRPVSLPLPHASLRAYCALIQMLQPCSSDIYYPQPPA